MDKQLPAMWLVPLKCRKKKQCIVTFTACVILCFHVRVVCKLELYLSKETAAAKCKESMVLMKQSWS